MEVSGQPHILAALTPGEESNVHTAQETGWTQQMIWIFWR
jgi:hypothetical protein